MHRVGVIDSHTAGEPTRVVLSGAPDLGPGPVAQQLQIFRDHHDAFRSAVVNEPRGSDVLVGALLVQPSDLSCAAGVIFFNNVGLLGMCGHGSIGVIATLAHLGRIGPGAHRLETSVGVVTAVLHPDGRVSITNVPSHRHAAGVVLEVPGIGRVVGDVAWSGNWFFLVDQPRPRLDLADVATLTSLAWRIRQAVNENGFPEVDHVEFFGPPKNPSAHSRNFVLCPGQAYDRSPCGTGTSAKLACLAADQKLAPGQIHIQEGILGTTFEATYQRDAEGDAPGRDAALRRPRPRPAGGIGSPRAPAILPTITGTAYITAEATLLLDPRDPFQYGLTAPPS